MKTNTKWHSLRTVSTQLNRKGVGRSNLILILKQEGIIQEDKWPKSSLMKNGSFRVKVHLIKTNLGGVIQLNTIQISDKGIQYLKSILEKRDNRISLCNIQIQRLAERKRVFIRTKIKTI